jgi:transcription-repair coupling factor (superfamily II helicase)
MDLGVQNPDGTPNLQEFLHLEYADNATLYVPVSQLQLISRYTGVSADEAPLHKLGSGQWEKAKRKAAEQVRDSAAELLNIYARGQPAWATPSATARPTTKPLPTTSALKKPPTRRPPSTASFKT